VKIVTSWNKIFSFLLYYLVYFIFLIYFCFIIIYHIIFFSFCRYTSQNKIKEIYGKIFWKQQTKANSYIILTSGKDKFFFFIPNDIYEELKIGDFVLLKTVLKDISFRNKQEFYLYSSFNVSKYGYVEEVLRIDKNKSFVYKLINWLLFTINSLKEKLVELVNTNLNQPYSGIILRLTLGYKDVELDEILKYFQDAGVAHVLVVSGLHVGLIYTFWYFILKFFIFDKRIRIIFVSLLILFFMFLTGCSPPVVRSTMIILSFCIAELLHRKQQPIRSLIIAAFVILLVNPTNLFSVSFQLSFIACFGIIYFYPSFYSSLKNFIEKTHPILSFIVKLFLVTTSAQIVTLPVVAYYFNKFSIISFLSNIFVIPITTILLWLCMFGYITSFLTKLNIILWETIELITFIYISLVKFFSQIPYCVINVAKPFMLSIVIYFFVITIFVPILLKKGKYKSFVFIVIVAICVLFINFRFKKRLKITFLDVGLGDCVLVQTANKNILIDTGDSTKTAMYKISPYLREKGIFTIHYLLITHPHYPHYGGTEFLINNFKIENIFLNEIIHPHNLEYQKLVDKIRQKNIKLCFIDKVKTLKFSDTEIVFEPNIVDFSYDEETFYDDNSVFVKIKYKDSVIFLTNDIPLKYLVRKMCKNTLFFQFPRHGKYKEDLLEVKEGLSFKPKFLVVSTDKYLTEIKKIGIPVYTTVEHGNVSIIVRNLKLKNIKKTLHGTVIYM